MTRHLKSLTQEAGGALMGAIILSFILIGIVLWTSYWSLDRGRSGVSQITLQHAREYAESGVSAAGPWLKNPSLRTDLPPGSTNSITMSMPNGRVDVGFYRTSTDVSLVDTFATGYYFIPRGGVIDPTSGKNAQLVCINAKFRIANVSDYLIAVPGTLQISYGTIAPNGLVYAQDLIFQSGTGNPQTHLGTAYYYASATPTNPTFVQFDSNPAAPVRLSYRPNFTTLDPSMRALYQGWSGGVNVPPLNGTVPAPTSHVYFVTGDVHIAAAASPLVVQGVYVIYTTGMAYIHNNITLADTNSWVAILSEENIDIASDAPNNITLNGTFVSNGPFTADLVGGNPRPMTSTLQVNGGIISMTTISVSTAYPGPRAYSYSSSQSPDLILPNLTNLLQYAVVEGNGSL